MVVDTGASFTLTMNDDLVNNAVFDPEGLNVNTNAEQKSINNGGEMGGLKAKVWTNESGMANVFSFADVTVQHHMMHDNAQNICSLHNPGKMMMTKWTLNSQETRNQDCMVMDSQQIT